MIVLVICYGVGLLAVLVLGFIRAWRKEQRAVAWVESRYMEQRYPAGLPRNWYTSGNP